MRSVIYREKWPKALTHKAYSDFLILLRNTSNVLNPLFWDDLRSQLEAAADNGRKLLNLRQRMARICVFDSAYGAGNFPIIACKKMRVIEDEVKRRRDEAGCRSDIPLANFCGIELRHGSAGFIKGLLIDIF